MLKHDWLRLEPRARTHLTLGPRAAWLLWVTGVIAACGHGCGSGTAGACAQGTDAVIPQESGLGPFIRGCVAASRGNGSAAVLCFADGATVGGSSECISCLDTYIACAAQSCLAACSATDGGETACDACEVAACGSAFTACSGEPPPT